jgi:hypothetical protein
VGTKRACGLFITICLAGGMAMAQQEKGTPPAKSFDDGPGLVATMKFIQDTLNAVGPVNYASYGHDSDNGHNWANHFSNEVSIVAASPAACRINYHYKAIRDGKVLMDAGAGFLLKDVQRVDVVTRKQYFDEENLAIGHPSWTAKVDPTVFVVRVQKSSRGENQFLFLDEQLANRVAQAITNAVELCVHNK